MELTREQTEGIVKERFTRASSDRTLSTSRIHPQKDAHNFATPCHVEDPDGPALVAGPCHLADSLPRGASPSLLPPPALPSRTCSFCSSMRLLPAARRGPTTWMARQEPRARCAPELTHSDQSQGQQFTPCAISKQCISGHPRRAAGRPQLPGHNPERTEWVERRARVAMASPLTTLAPFFPPNPAPLRRSTSRCAPPSASARC